MNIDIEAIVREEVRSFIRENLVINNVPNETVEVTVNTKRMTGRRRTTEEMALHKLEKEKGRQLTPEEKGEAKALVQIDATTENKTKEAAIKKNRIDKIAAEGMAAASKELAEEAQNTERVEVKEEEIVDSAASDEAEIPKTESLNIPNSLFTS